MPKKLEDLRNHLFETLDSLRNEEKPMDLDRARTIAEVAQAIINSAKVEVDFLRVTGQKSQSEFLPAAPPLPAPTPALNGGSLRNDGKVKCNQCPETVLPKDLGEHKRTKHAQSGGV